MNDLEFKRKYLKYKLKYLQLKQSGGMDLCANIFTDDINEFKKLVPVPHSYKNIYVIIQEWALEYLKKIKEQKTDKDEDLENFKKRCEWFETDGGFVEHLARQCETVFGKLQGTQYTNFINALFNIKRSDIRSMFTKIKSNTKQCVMVLTAQNGTYDSVISFSNKYLANYAKENIYNKKLCYICGTMLEGIEGGQDRFDCEHILSIFDAVSKGFLILEDEKPDEKKQSMYGLSHSCCNKLKDCIPLLNYDIAQGKYVFDNVNTRYILEKIWNETHAENGSYDCNALNFCGMNGDSWIESGLLRIENVVKIYRTIKNNFVLSILLI